MAIGFPNASRSTLLSALLAWRRTSAREGRLTSYRDRYWVAVSLSFLPLRLEWVMRLFGSDKHQEGQHAYGHSYHKMFRALRYARSSCLRSAFCQAHP